MQVSVRAAESTDECPDFGGGAVAEGGLDELQRGRPAFGSKGKGREHVSVKWAPITLAEQTLRLRCVEPKIAGCQLGDFSLGAKPRDRDGRFPARHEN